jgi:hypothetical protein
VKGAFIVTSTEDIKGVCDNFQKLKSNGDIQGRFTCTPLNANANEGSEGTGSSSNKKDGASMLTFSSSLAVVAAMAALVQML